MGKWFIIISHKQTTDLSTVQLLPLPPSSPPLSTVQLLHLTPLLLLSPQVRVLDKILHFNTQTDHLLSQTKLYLSSPPLQAVQVLLLTPLLRLSLQVGISNRIHQHIYWLFITIDDSLPSSPPLYAVQVLLLTPLMRLSLHVGASDRILRHTDWQFVITDDALPLFSASLHGSALSFNHSSPSLSSGKCIR